MPQNIVSDTSCLILFSKIDEFQLLKELFGEIVTPEAVAHEFKRDLPDWIRVMQYQMPSSSPLNVFLDKGEASAISMALELRDPLLLIVKPKLCNG